MDVNTQYKSAIVQLDLTQSLLGRYIGLEPSRVSRALTEEIPFDTAETNEIEQTIAAMRLVQSEIPLPINWAQIGKCKPLVDQRRKTLQEVADPMHVRGVWFVRLNIHDYFQGLRSDGSVIASLKYYNGGPAAFTNYGLANEVVNQLKQRNIAATAEQLTCERRQSTITTSLEELGFALEKEQTNVGNN
jgi:hypothetical protein